MILLGYSLGSRTLLRAINEFPPDEPLNIAAIILVAPFSIEHDALNASRRDFAYADFFRGIPVWPPQRIIDRTHSRFVIFSDNDVQVQPWQSALAAQDLEAQEIIIPGRGHFVNQTDFDVIWPIFDGIIPKPPQLTNVNNY